MGTDSAAQFSALWRSLALGGGYVLLYDLLRALRLRSAKRTADLLDALFCLLLALSLPLFSLRVGGGELRLYMLFAILLGAVLFFALLSPLLRPLWGFWADTLGAFLLGLCLPLRKLKKKIGRLHKLLQRLFLFFRREGIIKSYRRSARRSYRSNRRKE